MGTLRAMVGFARLGGIEDDGVGVAVGWVVGDDVRGQIMIPKIKFCMIS
jgi:hypothetical protein